MVKDKQLKNKNNKRDMKSNTVSRSVGMRDLLFQETSYGLYSTPISSGNGQLVDDGDGVFKSVKRIIAEKLGLNASDITNTQGLIDDLGADSLDVVEIINGMEEEFGITFDDEDVDKLQTVGDTVNYINSKK
jgi:acyl carrier protein